MKYHKRDRVHAPPRHRIAPHVSLEALVTIVLTDGRQGTPLKAFTSFTTGTCAIPVGASEPGVVAL